MRLDRNQSVLVVIDVQEKLMPVIDAHEEVAGNIGRLVRGCHILGVPALLTEQYVKGLGATIEPVRRAFDESGGYRPIEKQCFSAQGCDTFTAQLAALERRQAIVAGVETHVCVYQTVRDLLAAGFDVTVAADAVSSRTPQNKSIALQRMTAEGAKIASTEMVLFDLLRVAGTDEFRAISRLVK